MRSFSTASGPPVATEVACKDGRVCFQAMGWHGENERSFRRAMER